MLWICNVVKELRKLLKYVSAEWQLRYEPKNTQIIYNRLDAELYYIKP